MKYKIIESTKYEEIMNKYHINPLLAKVIDFHQLDENLETLLNPRLIYHDFSLFSECDQTIERIKQAIINKEKICVYGDYDCDGILATTILTQALIELNANVGYHIPDRYIDGYGLNVERVKQMEEKGYQLIITVDNGIKAFDAIEYAYDAGIDVIVTDHHQYDEDLPEAYSIIHTKLSPKYPFKEISGGFVAYKLASALFNRQDKYLYCLAAITTISDMMPLLDENRSLVKKALQFMKEEHYPQLDLLLGNQQYTTSSIGFTIAPKINSFGRLSEIVHPNILVKYFLKNASLDFMQKVASKANEINTKRQSLTNEQYNEAIKEEHQDFLFYSSSDVHQGLVGLIAGKYTREYERPSFVMHYDHDKQEYRGSARSVEGFNLFEFFVENQEYLKEYGGHALAGGFTVTKRYYSLFKKMIEQSLLNKQYNPSTPVLLLNDSDLSLSNVESLSKLEPYGMNNEEPLFILKDVNIDKLYTLSEGKHLKMDITYPLTKIQALYFNKGSLISELQDQQISLVGTININEFRNIKTINFIIKDIIV